MVVAATIPSAPSERSLLSPAASGAAAHQQSWKWLGTLRRSLSYGSDDGDEMDGVGDWDVSGGSSSFTDEDRAALDAVFKRPGSASDAARMRSKLADLADMLESCRERADAAAAAVLRDAPPSSAEEEKKDSSDAANEALSPSTTTPDADKMTSLLLDVGSTCHNRPDFSAAFVAMGGLEVLLGCASERRAVPRDVRGACFVLLSALALNNPSIQLRLLNEGAVRVMAELYFAEFPKEEGGDKEHESEAEAEVGMFDESGAVRGRIVQAIDAAIVDHAVAEHRFCDSERGRNVIEAGMGVAVLPNSGGGGGKSPQKARSPPRSSVGGSSSRRRRFAVVGVRRSSSRRVAQEVPLPPPRVGRVVPLRLSGPGRVLRGRVAPRRPENDRARIRGRRARPGTGSGSGRQGPPSEEQGGVGDCGSEGRARGVGGEEGRGDPDHGRRGEGGVWGCREGFVVPHRDGAGEGVSRARKGVLDRQLAWG